MNRKEMLLTIAAEEACEVAQAITKALRFGIDEYHEPIKMTNAERIVAEVNDLYAMCQLLASEGMIPTDFIDPQLLAAKHFRVDEYMGYSQQCGILTD